MESKLGCLVSEVAERNLVVCAASREESEKIHQVSMYLSLLVCALGVMNR